MTTTFPRRPAFRALLPAALTALFALPILLTLLAGVCRAADGWLEDAARPAGTAKTLEIAGVECVFRWIPAGSFIMGSPTTEKDRFEDEVQHEVTLTRGFWALETETTQRLWTAAGLENRSGFKGDDMPVERVGWGECVGFTAALNALGILPEGLEFRLPTEAEWEYACRAGTTSSYFWGEEPDPARSKLNLNEGAHEPVRSFPPNPWGLHDMHGNVWEWTADLYDDYPAGPATDPRGPAEGGTLTRRVYRSGSWDGAARGCRSAYRAGLSPTFQSDRLGFRFVIAPTGE